jgi:hypothetical protein
MITKVGIRVKDVEIDTLMEILDADGSGEYFSHHSPQIASDRRA